MYISPQTRIENLRKAIQEAFGDTSTLNTKQLWALVKLSKYVRLRARNNAAFNNLFSALFPHAQFKQVNKTRADGSSYIGLSIHTKDSLSSEIETNEDEEE